MEQLTTVNKLALFQTSKEERTSFVNDIVERIENGDVDPLLIHLQIKCMEDIITQLTSTDVKKNKNVAAATRYKSVLLQEAAKQDGKSFVLHNAKFETKEAGTKYHFDKTGDFIYSDLEKECADLEAKKKAREAFLKTLPIEGMELLNEETGEMLRVYPPYKTSTTSLQVSLK